jgi:hypothetical protein
MLCNDPSYVHSLPPLPTGDFELFLNKLENVNYLYRTKSEFVIYGDTNTNCLTESYDKLSKLTTDISSFTSVLDFRTRIQNYFSIFLWAALGKIAFVSN